MKEQERLDELLEEKSSIETNIVREESKLDKTKIRVRKQVLDLEHLDGIEAKPIPFSTKVSVEKNDFDSMKTAVEKFIIQEKKESKLQKILDAANKRISELLSKIDSLTKELAGYKSVLGKLRTADLEHENNRLKSKIRSYENTIERKNLWHFFTSHHSKAQDRDEER
jgi:hypothetical protein